MYKTSSYCSVFPSESFQVKEGGKNKKEALFPSFLMGEGWKWCGIIQMGERTVGIVKPALSLCRSRPSALFSFDFCSFLWNWFALIETMSRSVSWFVLLLLSLLYIEIEHIKCQQNHNVCISHYIGASLNKQNLLQKKPFSKQLF